MVVIWEPQEKQRMFLERFEDEALYGGAAGGGKSDALLAEALRQVHIKHYRAIIFRKTYPECRDLIDRSRDLYPSAFPTAKYNDQKHCWEFPSGAKIYFGSMQHAKDKTKYQGRRFDFIGFDELTHFTFDEYSYMFSRNRSGGPGTRCYMRATCNPGGVGHGWVKERFVSGKEPNKTHYIESEINGKTFKRSLVFIPSTVFDNKILLQNNPNYIISLASLPHAEQKALLYGDWNSFSGQVFTEFRDEPDHYIDRKNTHVITPFDIPKWWSRYRSFDFGYAKPFSVGWWAIDEYERVYRYRELYGCVKDQPNTGVMWEPREIAAKIKEIEDEFDKDAKIFGIADPAIWDNSRGVDSSIAGQMEKEGVYFSKADNTRLAGKMQLHYRFSIDDDTQMPMFYVFNTCKHFIRTIPNLVYDAVNIEDIDTKQEDHIYDEVRYFLMINPIKSKLKKSAIKQFNPLDLI